MHYRDAVRGQVEYTASPRQEPVRGHRPLINTGAILFTIEVVGNLLLAERETTSYAIVRQSVRAQPTSYKLVIYSQAIISTQTLFYNAGYSVLCVSVNIFIS